MKRIYLDNSATTMVAPEVIEEMNIYNKEKYGNASSLHSFGQEAREALENARERIAKKLNAEPQEIVFTSGGSESNNLAIFGVKNSVKGNHIITSNIEHPAVLGVCSELEKQGYKITYLKADKEGLVNVEDLKKAITKDTILVSIMHANNEIGTIQPIEEIGMICKEKNVLFHTDTVQSFSKVPIDVKKTNIDLISFSAHKMHGPKGVGGLYIRKGLKLKKMIHGGHHEFDVRAGTENVPGVVGFAKAVELIEENDLERMKKLRDRLISGILGKVPDTILNGSREKRLVNNVNITFKGIEGESILLQLDMEGIAVSTGSACSSHSLKASHVLLALGMPHEDAHGSIRFSLSKYNTEEEIDFTIKSLVKIVKQLREMSPLVK